MSEVSTTPRRSSPPSSSTRRADMPGISSTSMFRSCRNGTRARSSLVYERALGEGPPSRLLKISRGRPCHPQAEGRNAGAAREPRIRSPLCGDPRRRSPRSRRNGRHLARERGLDLRFGALDGDSSSIGGARLFNFGFSGNTIPQPVPRTGLVFPPFPLSPHVSPHLSHSLSSHKPPPL